MDFRLRPPPVLAYPAATRLLLAISRYMAIAKKSAPQWWTAAFFQKLLAPYTVTTPIDFGDYMRRGGKPVNVYDVPIGDGIFLTRRTITPILLDGDGKLVAILITTPSARKLFRINRMIFDYGATDAALPLEDYFLDEAPKILPDFEDTWHLMGLWWCWLVVKTDTDPLLNPGFSDNYKRFMLDTNNLDRFVRVCMELDFAGKHSDGGNINYGFKGSLIRAGFVHQDDKARTIREISIANAAAQFATAFDVRQTPVGFRPRFVKERANAAGTLGFFGDMTEKEKDSGFVKLGLYDIGGGMFKFDPRYP